MQKKGKPASVLSVEWGFASNYLSRIFKKHYEEIKKEIPEVVEEIWKGKRHYWIVKDEKKLKEWLMSKGYHI